MKKMVFGSLQASKSYFESRMLAGKRSVDEMQEVLEKLNNDIEIYNIVVNLWFLEEGRNSLKAASFFSNSLYIKWLHELDNESIPSENINLTKDVQKLWLLKELGFFNLFTSEWEFKEKAEIVTMLLGNNTKRNEQLISSQNNPKTRVYRSESTAKKIKDILNKYPPLKNK